MTFLVVFGLSLTAKALVYQGLTNTPSGNALIANQLDHGSNRVLVVSNLGSSGQDGVSIAVPSNLSGLDVSWQALDDADTLPVGAYIQEQISGPANGLASTPWGTLTMTKAGSSNYVVSADYSAMGASTYTVQAYLKGALVGQATNQDGGALAVCGGCNTSFDWEFWPDFGPTIDWGNGTPILLGGAALTADQLYISIEGVSMTRMCTAMQITASQVPTLTITGENASLVYQGLTNTSLGSALIANQLDHGSNNNWLVVSNLGSSGQDGVSIALPSNLSGLDVSWLALDVSNTLPVGAYVQEQMIGMSGTGTIGPWGTLTLTKLGTSNYVVSADYSPLGASTYTVQAYLKGALVAQVTNQDGASLARCVGGCTTFDWELWPNFGPTMDWGGGGTLLSLGTANVMCDLLYVIPENVVIASTPTAMQITASQVPSLTITSENASLVYQGLTNTSLGNALIANQLDHGSNTANLVVGNLGSSGQDGVSIDLPGGTNNTGFDVTWQALDVSNTLPVGAYVQEQIIGTAGAVTKGALGTVTVTKTGASPYPYRVSANYSPIGASTYTVQAYLKGALVGQATNQAGASLAVCGGCCTSFDWEFWPRFGPTSDWDDGTPMLLGGAAITCDRLYIVPENVPITSAPTAMQITASQVPSLTITSENASLVYQGLTNTSLGNALIANQLDHGSNSNWLVISNLGSSGQDGVSIALPRNLSGLDVGWQPLDDSDTLPVDAYIQEQIIGATGSGGNGLWGSLTMTKTGSSHYIVTADYSPLGASAYTVQAYLKGALVAQATNQPGASLAICGGCCTSFDWEFWPRFGPTSDWGDGGTTMLLGGADITADRLYIIPENVPITSTPTAMQITASQVPVLTITSENASLVYQGLTNTSLGNALIANQLDHGSNTVEDLVVSNLGSSGQDGVSIAMPSNLSALEVHWQSLDPSNTLPVGAYVQEQMIGTAGAAGSGTLGTVTVTKTGTNGYRYLVSADYSPVGASTYTVQAYRNRVLVAQATGQSGASLAQAQSDCGSFDWEIWPHFGPTVGWGSGGTLLLLGTASVTCDQLYIIPENVSWSSAPTAMQITASQVPVLTITSENVSMVYDGLTNTTLGNASMVYWGFRVSSNQLVIGNLGSSGQDGVEVALNPGNNFAGSWLPLDPSDTLPVGAYVQSQMIGTAGSVTNGVLGSVKVKKGGKDNYQVSWDYSPLGSVTHTVQVYNGGTLVAQLTGQLGVDCAIVKLPPGTCTINPWLNQEWPFPTDITLVGGPTVTGTEILVIPEGGTPVSSISAARILTANIPSFILTSETVSVSYGGLTSTPVGNALIANQLDHGSNRLVVSNLGSSGQDGVDFALPSNSPGLDVIWNPLEPSGALPVGAYVQERLVGTANGVTGLLGTITMAKNCAVCGGSNWVVSADFSPIGATTYTVEGYRNGVRVAQATGQLGAALATCNIYGDSGCIPTPPILKGGWDWPQPGPFLNIAGGAAVQCDHLYITPENVKGATALTDLQLTASQVPSLSLTAVTASPLRVSLSQTPQNMTLQWFGTGVPQTSTDLKTWTDLTNVVSPYVIPTGSATRDFYRIKQPIGN